MKDATVAAFQALEDADRARRRRARRRELVAAVWVRVGRVLDRFGGRR